MRETVERPAHAAAPIVGPQGDLYIYWIEGRLGSAEEELGDHFIGNWEEDDFSFLFFTRPSDDKVRRLLALHPRLTLQDRYNMTYAEWLGETPRPFRAGRFLISPPWESVDSPGDGLGIVLDPGVVFGTGTHPTTRDCLEALELACSEKAIGSVLDLGTGTGLLALAAARLGCRRVLAVDSSLLAARTARKNIHLNRLGKRVLSVRGRAEACIAWHADLVVANVHHDVVVRLLESDHLYTKKCFILSGLLTSQAEAVAERLAQRGATVLEKWARGGGIWHTFLGEPPATEKESDLVDRR